MVGACTQTWGLPLEAAPIISRGLGDMDMGQYRLDTDDVVRVGVYLKPELTGDYPVLSNGIIAYPLIKTVPNSGRTIGQLEQALARRLKSGLINHPRLTVGLTRHLPFHIPGEVAKPGRFTYEPELMLDAAVATAGGYNLRANQRQFVLRHNGDGTARRPIRRPGEPFVMESGDIITIPRRYF